MSQIDLEAIEARCKRTLCYDCYFCPTRNDDIPALMARIRELEGEAALLRGTIAADDERLLRATERVGLPPQGCDAAEVLADALLAERTRIRELEAALATEQREHRATLRLAEEGEFSDDEEAVMEERQRCLDIVTRMGQAAMEYPGAPTVAGFAEAVRRAIEAGTDAR